MEYLVLQSYKKYKKTKEITLKDAFKKMSVAKKAIYILMLFLCIIAIVLIFLGKFEFTIFPLVIELFAVVFVYKNENKSWIENSAVNIQKRDSEYENMLKWLQEIKFGEKNQIRQLCKRCEKIIEKSASQKAKKEDLVQKIFTVIIFPVWTAIIIWTLGLDTETALSHIELTLSLTILLVMFYLLIISAVNEMDSVINSMEYDMQRMVNDLYGVLDRQFEITEDDIA